MDRERAVLSSLPASVCLCGRRQGQWFEEEVDEEEVVWTDTRLGALAGTG